ncbi:TerB N-terminal domain-containing protein [Paenibacillus dendritiformis]|uniref:TerB N-terminal domain-containing protein n=1 Tax=Paenibacillus dendritiformis TaxID=130049 RepID=UPI0018CE8054|nr:TerB N-terminal domain-containing protein [Paenibacillus dendritiformis]
MNLLEFMMRSEDRPMMNRNREIQFAELELEGGEEAVMAIPPRADTDKPAPRSRTADQEGHLSLAPSSFSTTKEKRFVEQARRWEGHVEPPAPFVPFMCYWPEYKDMSEGQARWYFYWRNEVREGRYPPTGLSYLFLVFYELINGIGWKEPVQGYRLMKEIWIAYREAFPKLDDYLPDWLIDFILVHRLDVSVRDVTAIAPGSVSGDALEWELMDRFRSDPADLPLEAATQLSDYHVMRSKFCANGGHAVMNRYFPKVFAAVDGYIRKKYGARLIERLHLGEPAKRERYLFRSAVYDSTLYGSSAAIECVPITSHGPLRAFVTQLIRLTENTLRGLCGYKGKLRGTAVEPEIAALVQRYLEREVGRAASAEQAEPGVRINADKLARLQAESDEVRDLLTVTEEVGEPEGGSRIGGGQRDEPSGAKRAGQPGEPAGGCSADMPAGLCTEAGEVRTLLRRLTNEQLRLLTALLAHGGELDGQALAKQSPPIMIDLAMDEINEAALGALGNLVLEEEAGMIRIAEDYREELAVMGACQPSSAASPASGEDEEGKADEPGMSAHGPGPAGLRDGMDEEWIQFERLLEPVHRLALQAMLAGGDQHSLLKLAEAHGTMAELLIDEINSASMDAIGDLIIDGDELADDYLPLIEKLAR